MLLWPSQHRRDRNIILKALFAVDLLRACSECADGLVFVHAELQGSVCSWVQDSGAGVSSRELLRNGICMPKWDPGGLGFLEEGAHLDRTVAVSA